MNKISPKSLLNNSRRKMISIQCCNDDMLIEILLWLPAKPLIKFKSVCKHWLSLISTDQFCHLHTLRHPKSQPSLILQVHKTSNFFYLDTILNHHKQLIPYTFTIPNPKILSSCNGQLLLQSDQPEKSCYVYNPTTRQSRKIGLTNSDKYVNDLGLTLAIDPSISSHYKIVCVRSATILRSEDKRCCQIEVYESESFKWKLCVESFTTNAKFCPSGVNWKNVVHFSKHPPLYQYVDIDKYIIGKMNPGLLIPWPSGGCGGSAINISFRESNGHLNRILRVSPRHGDDSITIYQLQDNFSEWLKKYHDGFRRLPHPVDILRFMQGDDGQTCTLVYHVSGKIMAYRFLDKRFEELVDLTDQIFYRKDSEHFCSRNVHQFGESMAPV